MNPLFRPYIIKKIKPIMLKEVEVEKNYCCSLKLTCADKHNVGRFEVIDTGCEYQPNSTYMCRECLEYILKTYQDTRCQNQRFSGLELEVVYKGRTDYAPWAGNCKLCKCTDNIVGFYSGACCNPFAEYCLDCIESKLHNKRTKIRVFKSGNKRIIVKRFT